MAFPTLAPVRVRQRRVFEADGSTDAIYRCGRIHHFVVNVCPLRSWAITFDTLLHEWAHVLAWNESDNFSDHDAHWGVMYARIYDMIYDRDEVKR